MAISLPSGVFSKYNEAIVLFERTCKLIYPEKRTECPNCIISTIGRSARSTSIYKSGGDYPFPRGMPCPLCGGVGYKATISTDEIPMRVYWNRKNWIDVGFQIDVPDNVIQTVSDMTHMPKIKKAQYMELKEHKIASYETFRFQRMGSSYPQGFKQNPVKYLVNFWERRG